MRNQRAVTGQTQPNEKFVVFNLDGTLAESKSPLDAEKSTLLGVLPISARWMNSCGNIGHAFQI